MPTPTSPIQIAVKVTSGREGEYVKVTNLTNLGTLRVQLNSNKEGVVNSKNLSTTWAIGDVVQVEMHGRINQTLRKTISTVRTSAVRLVHRDVVYVAKIKHGPVDADKNGGVTLSQDEVMTTFVLAAESHVKEALSATIDGNRYGSAESIRPFGFQTNRYILVKWKRVNEIEAP